MVRKKIEIETTVCEFCGYKNIGDFSCFLKVDKCIKCGRDFCPNCGDFGEKGRFICNECRNG